MAITHTQKAGVGCIITPRPKLRDGAEWIARQAVLIRITFDSTLLTLTHRSVTLQAADLCAGYCVIRNSQ